jgi:hypothetical protein
MITVPWGATPSELIREQLEDVVRQVRDILWLDPVTGALDPDRSWTVETIEWVSGVLEDAGLRPDPVWPSSPATDGPSGGPPVAAMRSALEALIRTIEATGGCLRPGRRTINLGGQEIVESESDLPVPAGDEEWADLADAYLLACRALGREPMLRDRDDDEILEDVEDADEI